VIGQDPDAVPGDDVGPCCCQTASQVFDRVAARDHAEAPFVAIGIEHLDCVPVVPLQSGAQSERSRVLGEYRDDATRASYVYRRLQQWIRILEVHDHSMAQRRVVGGRPQEPGSILTGALDQLDARSDAGGLCSKLRQGPREHVLGRIEERDFVARARQPDGLDAGATPDVGDALGRRSEMRFELSTHELAPDDPAQRLVLVDEPLACLNVIVGSSDLGGERL
jgi:hypothetical protein